MQDYKILIVEDEMIAALALQETLQRAGCRVITIASSAQEALSSLQHQIPDLVLMDINLEGKEDGIIIGKKILHEYELPVVFITAYADRETIKRAREVFPYGYIVKPWQEGELLAVLETAIYKHLADRKTHELQETRNKFFSIIGHDLRSPLAALAVTTRALGRHLDTLSKEQLKEFVEDIQHTVENLYAFTDNMLEWAKIQSGRLEVHTEQVPLLPLIEEVHQLLRGKALQKEVVFTIDVPINLSVLSDKNMLRSVLMNLLSNGIKFSYPGGRIHIEAGSCGEGEVQLYVSDKGVGMSPDHVDALLSFTSAMHTPGTQEEKGTGLGLLLCKEFVEANGGTLTINSKLHEGTIISITLPQAPY
jgi:two-component system sensor histidine kinase/response regulator